MEDDEDRRLRGHVACSGRPRGAVSVRVALGHRTAYRYDRLVSLSPQTVRLRHAPHTRTRVVSYSLEVEPRPHFLNWQQDPFGNWQARVVFPGAVHEFVVTVDLVAELSAFNPFDFFVEDSAEDWPFEYERSLEADLRPYLRREADAGRLRPGIDLDRAADYLARSILSLIGAPGRWDLEDPEQVRDLVATELLGAICVPRNRP